MRRRCPTGPRTGPWTYWPNCSSRAGAFRVFDAQLMAMTVRATINAVAARVLIGLDPAVAAEELVTTFDLATRN